VYDIEYTLREVDDLCLPRIYKESLKVSTIETEKVPMREDKKTVPLLSVKARLTS
jgi:hypothetical protein